MNFDINLEKITEVAQGLLVEYSFRLIGAIAIFLVGKFAVNIILNIVIRLLKKSKLEDTLLLFIKNITRAMLLTVVIVAALDYLGVQTASLVAIMGAAGLAVGLALQGSLSNFGAGVLIIIFRPFKIGDFIDSAGVKGKVAEINIFTTELTTPDNKMVIIPNSKIIGDPITNFSAKGERRIDFVFGIGYDDDILKAKNILTEIIEGDERILKDPAVTIGVLELGDSSVNFAVRPWVKLADYWDVHFDITEKVKLRFDEEGISIPYPQRDVHIYQADAPDSEKK